VNPRKRRSAKQKAKQPQTRPPLATPPLTSEQIATKDQSLQPNDTKLNPDPPQSVHLSQDDSDEQHERAEFESLTEVPTLPWDAIIRNWLRYRQAPTKRSSTLILVSVMLGNFAAGVVYTLLSVARQSISEDLKTSPSLVLWAFTGPSLVAAILSPALGRLGDLRGHRKLYLFGLVGGVFSSLLVGLSPNVYALIVFRTIAAAITTALGPSSLAIIFSTFDREKRVKAMGYWSLVGAGSPVLGVLLGGPLVDHFGWRSMFLAQCPFFLIALVVAIKFIPDTGRRPASKFDAKGAILLGLTTFFLLFGANRGPEWGWTSARVLLCFALAPISLVTFIAWQKKTPDALLPLRLLKIRNVAAGMSSQMLAQFAYIGAGLILINDLLVGEGFFDFSLTKASRATIGRPIVFAIVAPIAGYLAVKYGERATATFGSAMIAVAMGMLAFSEVGGSLVLLVVAIGMAGFGMAFASPSLSASVANAVPEDRLGTIGAVQQLVVQTGSVMGTQVMVSIAAAGSVIGQPRLASSYRLAFYVALGVAIASTVLAAMTRRLPRDPAFTTSSIRRTFASETKAAQAAND
jgi:EmrB/QacA subfamily drug resistance transporter